MFSLCFWKNLIKNNFFIKLFLFLLIISLITSVCGCTLNDKKNKDARNIGEPVFVQAEKGEANTTIIAVRDYKITDQLKTKEGVLEAGKDKKFLLFEIETGVLIKENEIFLEINNKQLNGINSHNRTFSIRKKELIDYIYMVESHSSSIGLYPGAVIQGWVIFRINEDIKPQETYIKLKPDIVHKKEFRWKVPE